MLKAISDEGSGVYYFLEKKDDIPKSFADCLGGLLSVVSQNITLRLELSNGAKLLKYLSRFKTKGIIENGIEINIGDMLSEEKRDIIFSIKLPNIDTPNDDSEVCKVKLDYLNVIEMENESKEIKCNINRLTNFSKDFSISIELDKQRNRIVSTDALDKARKLADDGKLDEAKTVLVQCIDSIKKISIKRFGILSIINWWFKFM